VQKNSCRHFAAADGESSAPARIKQSAMPNDPRGRFGI
jgi:hypothetical protein